VEGVPWETVMSKQAYLLFYVRKGTPFFSGQVLYNADKVELATQDELLKSAENSRDQMNIVNAKLDEMKHQVSEKDYSLKYAQQQLSDAKVLIYRHIGITLTLEIYDFAILSFYSIIT